jgi:hypothetical protein
MVQRIPEIVYKYRDWNNSFHKNILLHNELYLASPKDFNDPFDCKIPINFTDMTEMEMSRFPVDSDLRRDPIAFQVTYEKLQAELMDKHYGIFSGSSKWNGILLWSHYANNHQGFCVGFKEEKLRYFGGFGRTGIVKYNTDFPKINYKIEKSQKEKFDRIVIQTTTKSEEWEYEEEYRLIKAFTKPPLPFERCEQISDDVISDVTLGINISIENKEEIIEVCRQKGILVYQAKKVPFKFEIDREKID